MNSTLPPERIAQLARCGVTIRDPREDGALREVERCKEPEKQVNRYRPGQNPNSISNRLKLVTKATP